MTEEPTFGRMVIRPVNGGEQCDFIFRCGNTDITIRVSAETAYTIRDIVAEEIRKPTDRPARPVEGEAEALSPEEVERARKLLGDLG